jgi:hypothetical protein
VRADRRVQQRPLRQQNPLAAGPQTNCAHCIDNVYNFVLDSYPSSIAGELATHRCSPTARLTEEVP